MQCLAAASFVASKHSSFARRSRSLWSSHLDQEATELAAEQDFAEDSAATAIAARATAGAKAKERRQGQARICVLAHS